MKSPLAVFFSGRVHTSWYDEWLLTAQDFMKRYDVTFFCALTEGADPPEFVARFRRDLGISDSQFCSGTPPVLDLPVSYAKFPETNEQHCTNMFYNNRRALDLIMAHEKQFAVIMKFRTEIPLDIPVELMEEQDWICIPRGQDHRGGINDQVAYGPAELMYKYCACFDYVEEMVVHRKVVFHPETLLRYHLENLAMVEVERVDFQYELRK